MFGQIKTVDSILSQLQRTVDDLIAVSDRETNEAARKDAEALRLSEEATAHVNAAERARAIAQKIGQLIA